MYTGPGTGPRHDRDHSLYTSGQGVDPFAAVVSVGWFKAEQDPHKLLPLSYTVGRWDLLVSPPQTDPAIAAWLMTAATGPLRSHTASDLLERAEFQRIVTEAEQAREAVWDLSLIHI